MKRFLALTLALALALVLAACSGSNVQSMMQDSGSSSSTPSAPADSTPASSAPDAPAEDGGWIGRTSESDPGYFEGRMGDRMRNVFFEYTVNSVDFPESYEGITAADGNQLLVANVTVKNVFSQNLPMSFYDFQIQWGDGDQDFGYQSEEVSGGNLMPVEYEIKRADSVTYDILYEVPADATEFSISYLEIWSDNTEGDVFFVYFEK